MDAKNIFSQAELSKFVEETLPKDAEKDHHTAVAFGFDKSGAKVAAVFKKDVSYGTWSFETGFKHEWTGDNQVGFNVTLIK